MTPDLESLPFIGFPWVAAVGEYTPRTAATTRAHTVSRRKRKIAELEEAGRAPTGCATSGPAGSPAPHLPPSRRWGRCQGGCRSRRD